MNHLSGLGEPISISKNPVAGIRLTRTTRNTVWPLLLLLVMLVGLVPVVCANAPVASFTANLTTGENPFAVQFVDTSTNSPAQWFWSFGDGTSSSESDPVHTYTIDGDYTVTLTVTNADGSHTVTRTGYISCTESAALPVPAFTSSATSGSKPFTVKFIDTSTESPTAWAWSFGDGATSAEQNPSHTYTKKGTFTVTLTVTNSGGSATATKGSYIVVSEASVAPVASFSATTTEGSIPLTVKFIDTSTNGPTSWIWTFGDGYSDVVQNPVHTYTDDGTYTVTMTATNSVGSSTALENDFITAELAAPIASFEADVTSGTAPLVVQFNDTSKNAPTSWSWYFGDDESSVLRDPLHVFNSAGSYTVVLTVKNEEGSNSTSRKKYINVSSLVAPVVSFTMDKTSGADSLTVHFTDTSTNKPTSWEWTFGDGSTSSEQNPVHTYSGAGTYTVALTATNSQGSRTYTSPGSITITGITAAPTATPIVPEEVLTLTPPDNPTIAPTEVPTEAAAASTGSSSGWLIWVLIIIAAAVIIGILLLRRRPPRGHSGSKSRDL